MICNACAYEADTVKYGTDITHEDFNNLNDRWVAWGAVSSGVGHAACIARGSQCDCKHMPVGAHEGH